MSPVPEPERYEPMPGLVRLPAWLWGKMGRLARIAAVVAVLAAGAATAVLAPQISETKEKRSARDRRAAAQQRVERRRALAAEQRPRTARSDATAPSAASARERLDARAALMIDVRRTIEADARRRVEEGQLDGTIRRVECERFPRGVGAKPADETLDQRRGRYSCTAVTSEFKGGVLGHPYRVLVDFESGRFTFCKISGVTGPSREDRLVTTPRACGGG